MQDLAEVLPLYSYIFFIIFVRILSILLLAPFFGGRNIPGRVKIFFALVLALIEFPLLYKLDFALPQNLIAFMFNIAREVLIGISMGFIMLMFFLTAQMAGQFIGIEIGFAMANVVDPQTQRQVSIIAQLKYLFVVFVFFTLNGHHHFLNAIYASFDKISLGAFVLKTTTIYDILHFSSVIFVLGMQISAPVLVSILIANVSLGIISRTVPQINVLFLGFPIKIWIGLGIITFSFATTIILLENRFPDFIDKIMLLITSGGS